MKFKSFIDKDTRKKVCINIDCIISVYEGGYGTTIHLSNKSFITVEESFNSVVQILNSIE